ncbi:ABC transporter permease [Streptomyces sp. NPDC059092]|uniref:ABC transporter permease n=1 Tax=Streptomyces sp. NPDC059092 TaxID=3346725 RepID=UPI00368F598A
MTFVDEVKNAVSVRAALLVLGVLALQLLFITSYVGALHSPKPTEIKVAVVAPGQSAAQLTTALKGLPGTPLSPRTLPDEKTARKQMLHRDIDAALIVRPRSISDTLLVATGQGTNETRALVNIFEALESQQQRSLRLTDIAPASVRDAGSLSSFYLVIGWCVGGYLCAAALAISHGARPANLSRAVIRLALLAVYAIVGGLLGAVITGPVLGALPGSVAALWGLGALTVFAVGALTLALQALCGVVGIGLAVLIVVIAGNPSSGGAYPAPMLPDFWRAISPALPPGAATWVARSIAYFRGNAVTAPLLVLSAWAVAGTAVTLVRSAFRTKDRPEGRPGTGARPGSGPGTAPRTGTGTGTEGASPAGPSASA